MVAINHFSKTIMRVIEPLLGIDDLMRITGLSRVSIYRNVSKARAGITCFPLPVWGPKQKLMWNAAEVEAFFQSRTAPQVPVIKDTKQQRRSSKELQARNEAARKALAERHGIFLNSNDNGE